MIKYFSVLVIIFMLLITMPACNKNGRTPGTSTEIKTDKSKTTVVDPIQKALSENAPKEIKIIKGSNSMQLETIPRDASEVSNEKRLAEKAGEVIVEHAIKNGIDSLIEEINKGRTGAFKEYLPQVHNYFSMTQNKNGIWTMVAHTIPEYIGFELDNNLFKDLTEWKYLTDVIKAGETGESNRIWVEGFYWQDPAWAAGKAARSAAYNRFFMLDGKNYWFYYSIWLDK